MTRLDDGTLHGAWDFAGVQRTETNGLTNDTKRKDRVHEAFKYLEDNQVIHYL